MGRRTLLLVAAFVVAALGTTLVFLYARGVQDSVESGQATVDVLVARELIPAGTTGRAALDSDLLVRKRIPHDNAPANALDDMTSVEDAAAQAPIYPGEVIVSSRFGPATGSAALQIPSGDIAMSFQFNDPSRVAGFVTPHSHVVVLFSSSSSGSGGAGGTSSGSRDLTTVLESDIEVLAAGGSTGSSLPSTGGGQRTTQQVPQAVLTLALDQEQARRLTWADGHGDLVLALRNKDSDVDDGGPVTRSEVITP